MARMNWAKAKGRQTEPASDDLRRKGWLEKQADDFLKDVDKYGKHRVSKAKRRKKP